MDHNFWQERWETRNIGFHAPDFNPLLVKYFHTLNLQKGDAIFVPLCGKTLDIHWLLAQGYSVIGSELVESAVAQLFQELAVEPRITKHDSLKRYQAGNLDVWAGDIFKLHPEYLLSVKATYDRAALVALPLAKRKQYTAHINKITNNSDQLLIVFDYNQSQMEGPPFSLSDEEVKSHYSKYYELSLLETIEVTGGLKGQVKANEKIWHLKKK